MRTCAAVIPAFVADWNLAFADVGLQPFHCGTPASGSRTVRLPQNAEAGGADSLASVPRYLATASRSSRRRGYDTLIITPKSSTRRIFDAGMVCSTDFGGVRWVVWSWQPAHRSTYTRSPRACANA